MTQPPAPSPRHPTPDDRHDTAEMPVTMGTMRRAFRINEIWTFLVACAVAAGAVLSAYRYVISEAEAAGRKGATDVEKRVAALEGELPEVRKDVRALYNTVLTGRRQERLERPLPEKDGGP